jgi:hypothetical protein
VSSADAFSRLPQRLRAALLVTFGAVVGEIRLIERSWRVRWHPRMLATTRRNRIYLRGTLDDFAANPELVLHEYFHVIDQWNTGRLTRRGYVWEWLRRGYKANRFEIEARAFTAQKLGRFRQWLESGH